MLLLFIDQDCNKSSLEPAAGQREGVSTVLRDCTRTDVGDRKSGDAIGIRKKADRRTLSVGIGDPNGLSPCRPATDEGRDSYGC